MMAGRPEKQYKPASAVTFPEATPFDFAGSTVPSAATCANKMGFALLAVFAVFAVFALWALTALPTDSAGALLLISWFAILLTLAELIALATVSVSATAESGSTNESAMTVTTIAAGLDL